MNGKVVFEMLEKMTDEERGRCVFPGFFDDEEADILLSQYANNGIGFDDDDDELYDALLATDKGKMAKWTAEAVSAHCEEWGRYVDALRDDVAEKAIEAVKASKK